METKFSQPEMSLSRNYIWIVLISENLMMI